MILSNIPKKNLCVENDLFGIVPKGKAIISLLNTYYNNLDTIKMFALYGEWGSGKTSLMDYIEQNINDKFNVYFFEAWMFEQDKNLAISLIDFLIQSSNNNSDFSQLKSTSISLLKGFSKSISVDIFGLASFAPGEIFNELDKEKEKRIVERSLFTIQSDFKKQFIKFEEETTNGKKNLIIIDDLDRCEPENVLNLLAAIKLFFTFGDSTVYICGLDKDAVKAAVELKYNNTIKSNEYLEKIFDVTINMQRRIFPRKMVDLYFPMELMVGDTGETYSGLITQFFCDLKFNNPRRIKKVLNKYNTILLFIEAVQNENLERFRSPNLISIENNGSIYETIMLLFFIILYEFYPESYDHIEDVGKKNNATLKQYGEQLRTIHPNIAPSDLQRSFVGLYDTEYRNKEFSEFRKEVINTIKNGTEASRIKLINLLNLHFSPTDIKSLDLSPTISSIASQLKNSKHSILVLFVDYLASHTDILITDDKVTSCRLEDFFGLANNWF